jgi:hypothetical protein
LKGRNLELFKLNEIDTNSFRKVFKNVFWPLVVVLVIIIAIQITVIWAYLNFNMRNIIAIVPIISMFCAVFFFHGIYELFRSLKSTNWILTISNDFIYIKFRSSLYEHLAKNDKQIIAIRPSEIEAFRLTHVNDLIATGRSESNIKKIYLDVTVCKELSMLQKALSNEHRDYGLGKTNKSRIEVSYLDFPVTVLQDDIIRINITGIKHKQHQQLFIELKKLGIKELDSCTLKFSFVNTLIKKDMLSEDTAKKRIVELLKEGRRLNARNAIEYYYLISRKQTNEMIEKLVQDHILK